MERILDELCMERRTCSELIAQPLRDYALPTRLIVQRLVFVAIFHFLNKKINPVYGIQIVAMCLVIMTILLMSQFRFFGTTRRPYGIPFPTANVCVVTKFLYVFFIAFYHWIPQLLLNFFYYLPRSHITFIQDT